MRRLLLPVDVVIVAYFAILTACVVARGSRVTWPLLYVGLHAIVVGTIFVAAWARRHYDDDRLSRLLHYWLPALLIFVAFRELHFLVPQVHPFDDRRYDWALFRLDQRWFGDVVSFLRSIASRPVSDLMHLCYWMYFPMPVILCVTLYRRGELARFRETAAVLFIGWYLSYLGYVSVPALGPHHVVDGPRWPELDGLLWGRFFHDLLIRLEWQMPDAFPSGHALIAVVVPILAWRHARDLFWWLAPFAAGCLLATVYLRYHYVVDVLASMALVPISIVGGRALTCAWDGGSAERGQMKEER